MDKKRDEFQFTYGTVLSLLQQHIESDELPYIHIIDGQHPVIICKIESDVGDFTLAGDFAPLIKYLYESRRSSEVKIAEVDEDYRYTPIALAFLDFCNDLPIRLPATFIKWLLTDKEKATLFIFNEKINDRRQKGEAFTERLPTPEEITKVFSNLDEDIERGVRASAKNQAGNNNRSGRRAALSIKEWIQAVQQAKSLLSEVKEIKKEYRTQLKNHKNNPTVKKNGFKPTEWLLVWEELIAKKYPTWNKDALMLIFNSDFIYNRYSNNQTPLYIACVHVAALYGVSAATLFDKARRRNQTKK